MLDFRRDMVTLSLKYPFIKKVIIDGQAWSDMCKSFDKMLGEGEGHTENHIEQKSGSMCFEKLCVEKVNEE